jgi:hypothetical protein
MITFIEPLYKSDTKIVFGWNPEPVRGVQSYTIYVGQVPKASALTSLVSGIGPEVSDNPAYMKKVAYEVTIQSVISTLSIASNLTFADLLLYFAIIYTDSTGTPSSIADSRVVEVPPPGISGRTRKDDPTTNRNMFAFSDEIQRWVKVSASGAGALVVDTSDYFRVNTTTEYTRDSSGNALTEKVYFSDRTSAGSPAKLIRNTYDGSGHLTKTVITDSTV